VVAPSAATGTVQFFDGGARLGIVTLSAVYSGDSSHGGSSATLSEVVQN
jgi:hypothetical protein